ncbi:hypothetical protein [Rhodospirillaceae bacterium SYSU D60014]|uniref:hypothetical protein n=1 Tax=Virgifigura deserti TaxID=2268457 RepID=UPI000E6756B3
MSAPEMLRAMMERSEIVAFNRKTETMQLLVEISPLMMDDLLAFLSEGEDDEPDSDGEEEPLEDDDDGEPEAA